MIINNQFSARLLVAIASMVLIAPLLLSWSHHMRVGGRSQSSANQLAPHDFGAEMDNYLKQGRYDDAVQAGLRALENQPSDEIVYQQIALVYLIRAEKDSEQREKWVSTAIQYVEKSLSLNAKDKDAAGVHLLQDALSFERAGDLSVVERCKYYARAKVLLDDRVPLLQGDQIWLAGKTFPLEPLRKENDKTLARVEDKVAKAGCK